MSGTFLIVILAALAAVGLSVFGLFNRGRSICCGVAGALVALFGTPCALHAWGEGQSIPWTAGYLVLVVLGLISILRQVKPQKKQLEMREEDGKSVGNNEV